MNTLPLIVAAVADPLPGVALALLLFDGRTAWHQAAVTYGAAGVNGWVACLRRHGGGPFTCSE